MSRAFAAYVLMSSSSFVSFVSGSLSSLFPAWIVIEGLAGLCVVWLDSSGGVGVVLCWARVVSASG